MTYIIQLCAGTLYGVHTVTKLPLTHFPENILLTEA